MENDRLTTEFTYKVVNSKGVTTVDITGKIADQSIKSAAKLQVGVLGALGQQADEQADNK